MAAILRTADFDDDGGGPLTFLLSKYYHEDNIPFHVFPLFSFTMYCYEYNQILVCTLFLIVDETILFLCLC